MRSPSEENPSDNQLFATSCDALRLRTQDAKPVVEGDDDDRAEGGEYARVPQVSRSPLERLPVHVPHLQQDVRVCTTIVSIVS